MQRVFSHAGYAALAIITTTVIFAANVTYSALPLVFQIISDTSISRSDTYSLALRTLGSSFSDLTLSSALYSGSLAVLIGINSALLLFYSRAYRAAPSTASVASGFLGGIAALLGFGCAACGSLFIISFAATLGGAGLIALLPFDGLEIGVAGFFLLLVSSILLSRAINKPPVCPI